MDKEQKTVTIDLTGVLKSFDGVTLQDVDEKGKTCDSKVKVILINGLLYHLSQDSGSMKLAKYVLAKKVYDNDSIVLNENEVGLIKFSVLQVFSQMIIGRIYELLEPVQR